MQKERSVFQEEARAESFRLLSGCYHLPEANIGEALDALEFEVRRAGASSHVTRYVREMKVEYKREGHLDALKVDYAKLFVGPYSLLAPPYGSVYLEGERKVMGESTLAVREIYRSFGLDTSENFPETPDHIAAELEFMYFLVTKEIEAMVSGDVEAALEYLDQQQKFLEAHLGAWVADFATCVEENAETAFFRNLARATRTFVHEQAEEGHGD